MAKVNPKGETKWLSPKQVSDRYGIPASTLSTWRNEKRVLPFTQPDGTQFIRYPQDECDAIMATIHGSKNAA